MATKAAATAAPGLAYAEALAELEAILRAVEDPALPVDELAPKIERAAALIAHCRGVLEQTELRVGDALRELQAATTGNGERGA
jgi:exodeoxyribonuclease VII small subunit